MIAMPLTEVWAPLAEEHEGTAQLPQISSGGKLRPSKAGKARGGSRYPDKVAVWS